MTAELDLDANTDAVHREILALLPPDLFDLTDLATGVARVEAMLGAAPVELPDDVAIDDHSVGTADGHEIVVRLYRPAGVGDAVAVLYWMHGGGMVLGDVSIDDAQCCAVAAGLGIVVASVDYRLAPRWPYPTPVDDCVAGYEWLIDNSGRLGLDRGRVAVGGGSAGGGLAASLTLRLRDGGGHQPCFQLLRYPMLDDRNDTWSSQVITDGRVWNRDANVSAWAAYLGELAGGDVPPHAAPARADDLSGLPPAIVTVGGLDLFVDEDVAYATRLRRCGVATELHVYPEAFHGSDVMVAHAETSTRWRRDEMAALARALA